MEEGQRSPGRRSGHSVKGNTVLNVPMGATMSPVPQTPGLLSQNVLPRVRLQHHILETGRCLPHPVLNIESHQQQNGWK